MFNSNDSKVKELQDQINALNNEAADLIHDPNWVREIGQQMSDEVWYGFNHANISELITNVERKGLAELAEIETEVRGLTAFHIARGGYIEESTIHAEKAYVPKDQIGIHFVEQVDRLETGFVPTAQKLIAQAPVRIDAEIQRRVIRTLQAAVPSSSAYYTATANLTYNQVADGIDAVKDVVESDVQEPIAIVGRSPMINKLRNTITNSNVFNAFLPITNERLLNGRTIDTFQGIPIVELRNFTDENGVSYFPANELWIVGKSAGKTVFYGTPRTTSWVENEAEYWHWQTRLNYGVSIYRPSHVRRIVDSSVAA